MTDAPKHPMAKFPEPERVNYLSLVARICTVDSSLRTEESRDLEILTKNLGLSDDSKKTVFQEIFSNSPNANLIEKVKILNDPEIGFSLISDMFFIALADSEVTCEEKDFVSAVSKELGISADKQNAIMQIQIKLHQLKDIPPDSEQFRKGFEEIAGIAGGVGVPLAAVCAAGIWGLSAVGITSGLAALGALVGGGMLAGTVFVVPTLAIGGAIVARGIFKWVFPPKK